MTLETSIDKVLVPPNCKHDAIVCYAGSSNVSCIYVCTIDIFPNITKRGGLTELPTNTTADFEAVAMANALRRLLFPAHDIGKRGTQSLLLMPS